MVSLNALNIVSSVITAMINSTDLPIYLYVGTVHNNNVRDHITVMLVDFNLDYEYCEPVAWLLIEGVDTDRIRSVTMVVGGRLLLLDNQVLPWLLVEGCCYWITKCCHGG